MPQVQVVLLTAPLFDFKTSTSKWITMSRKLARKIWGTISGIVYFGLLLIFLGTLLLPRLVKRKREAKEEANRRQEKDRERQRANLLVLQRVKCSQNYLVEIVFPQANRLQMALRYKVKDKY
jgi:hypothetical protein